MTDQWPPINCNERLTLDDITSNVAVVTTDIRSSVSQENDILPSHASQEQERNHSNENKSLDRSCAEKKKRLFVAWADSGWIKRGLRTGDELLEVADQPVSDETQIRKRLTENEKTSILVCRLNSNHDHQNCVQRARRKRRRILRWLRHEQRLMKSNRATFLVPKSICLTRADYPQPTKTADETGHVAEPIVSIESLVDKQSPTEGQAQGGGDAGDGNNDEKDSGLGKTDADSIKTNEAYSTDYESMNTHLGRLDQKARLLGQSLYDIEMKRYNSDSSLDREMRLLNQEMQQIQLQCALLNRQLRQNELNEQSSGEKVKMTTEPNQSAINKSFTDPPKPRKTISGSFEDPKRRKSTSDRLNRIKQVEKKESIKRWINGRLTTTVKPSSHLSLQLTNGQLQASMLSMVSKERQTTSAAIVENDFNRIEKVNKSINRMRSNSLESLFRHETTFDLNASEHEYAVINYASTTETATNLTNSADTQTSSQPPPLPPLPPQLSRNNGRASLEKSSKSTLKGANDRTPMLNQTMYTNQANLEQTMLFQQRLLRQAVQKKITNSHSANQLSNTAAGNNHPNTLINNFHRNSVHHSVPVEPADQPNPTKNVANSNLPFKIKPKLGLILGGSEIKIKRKHDGTRYISRRKLRPDPPHQILWPTVHQRVVNCDVNVINSTLEFDQQQVLRQSMHSQGVLVNSQSLLKERARRSFLQKKNADASSDEDNVFLDPQQQQKRQQRQKLFLQQDHPHHYQQQNYQKSQLIQTMSGNEKVQPIHHHQSIKATKSTPVSNALQPHQQIKSKKCKDTNPLLTVATV